MESVANNGSISLGNIFKILIASGSKKEVSIRVLNSIILTDLKLNIDNLDEDQKKALPYMLWRYIKNWPGWSKKEEYINGSIDLESWVLRFQNYIAYKMQLLVTKMLPKFKEESRQKESMECGSQTEFPVNFSNFNIDLSGPASLLNNLVFSGDKDHIRVEEHAERPWVPMDCEDLFNYPFVEVEFNSPELSFKRSFEPKLSQYLSCTSDFKLEESDFILGRSNIHSDGAKWPIKISILESYINALKGEVSSQVSPEQKEELIAVLDQFYQDMVDISIKEEVFENRRITFNIGRNVYKRTKKISNRDNGTNVVFNETCLPRVISSFRYFTGMQNDSATRTAADPDKIDFIAMMGFKPVITYKCTFCKVGFDGPKARKDLLLHLKLSHKRAQTYVCLKCKKCIEVALLSRRRWKCTCQDES